MVISSQDPIKDDVKDLESLGHTLRNGTAAIKGSLTAIEFRIQYMKRAVEKYEEILRDMDNCTEDKADEN